MQRKIVFVFVFLFAFSFMFAEDSKYTNMTSSSTNLKESVDFDTDGGSIDYSVKTTKGYSIVGLSFYGFITDYNKLGERILEVGPKSSVSGMDMAAGLFFKYHFMRIMGFDVGILFRGIYSTGRTIKLINSSGVEKGELTTSYIRLDIGGGIYKPITKRINVGGEVFFVNNLLNVKQIVYNSEDWTDFDYTFGFALSLGIEYYINKYLTAKGGIEYGITYRTAGPSFYAGIGYNMKL